MKNAYRVAAIVGSIMLCCLGRYVGGGESVKLPSIKSKPYQVAIAPSHLAEPPAPLFESDSRWAEVAKQADIYRYYGVQLMKGKEWDWTTHLDPKALVKFTKARNLQIACEFGDFHLGDGPMIPDASTLAFMQLDPIFEAGGNVSSIHLDGPVRRMITGVNQTNPNAITLDKIAARMVDFWKKIHAKYPHIRIGLVTNFPNWDYTRALLGYNGDYTDQSGVTYSEVLDTLHRALAQSGEKIAFVEVDCPYNYYRETRTRSNDAALNNAQKFIELQKWCEERTIRFYVVVNAEPRDAGAKGFHDLTCLYVFQLRQDGIFPDLFTVQSWYKEPAKNLPETEPFTFMNTAKDAISLIRRLYPRE